MGTSRPLWRALFLVGLWPATRGDAQVGKQPAIPLFTAEEAEKLRLLRGRLPDPLHDLRKIPIDVIRNKVTCMNARLHQGHTRSPEVSGVDWINAQRVQD